MLDVGFVREKEKDRVNIGIENELNKGNFLYFVDWFGKWEENELFSR